MELKELYKIADYQDKSGGMLFNGDYLKVIKDIDDGSVDLIVTDPPYLHEKGGRGKMLLGESLDREKFNMKKLGDFGKKRNI